LARGGSRRRIPIQLEDWITPDGQLDEQALEEKYGIGECSDRKIMLDAALVALQNKPARVGFDQIWRIFNNAKAALVQWYVGNNEPDDLRVVDTELNVVLGNLHAWAGREQRLFRLENGAGSVQEVARTLRPRTPQERQLATQMEARPPVWKPALKLADGEKPDIVQCLDNLMAHLNDDPLFRIWREQPSPKSLPSRYRRPYEGAPSPKGSIVTPATRALTKAGVTGWIRVDLLEATGLTTLARNRK
jgi:hypothetical protein